MKYLGYTLNFNFTATNVQLKVVKISNEHVLEILTQPGKSLDLNKGTKKAYLKTWIKQVGLNILKFSNSIKVDMTLELPKIKFVYTIQSKMKTNCVLPYDKIDMSVCSMGSFVFFENINYFLIMLAVFF